MIPSTTNLYKVGNTFVKCYLDYIIAYISDFPLIFKLVSCCFLRPKLLILSRPKKAGDYSFPKIHTHKHTNAQTHTLMYTP